MLLEALGSNEEITVKESYNFGHIYQTECFTCREYHFRRAEKISKSGY